MKASNLIALAEVRVFHVQRKLTGNGIQNRKKNMGVSLVCGISQALLYSTLRANQFMKPCHENSLSNKSNQYMKTVYETRAPLQFQP